MATDTSPAQNFASFREFYPFYLAEHSNRTSRRLHFVGTSLFVVQFVAALATGNAWLFLTGPVTGYAFAWIGHFVFEKNRPATFRFPFYSLAGDFVMASDILRGRIPW
jgi:hypothetical protein